MALRVVLRRLSAATLMPTRGAVPRRVLPSARRALAAPPRTPDDDDDDADDDIVACVTLVRLLRSLARRACVLSQELDAHATRAPNV